MANAIKIKDWLKLHQLKSFDSFGNLTDIQKIILKTWLIELYRGESSWYQIDLPYPRITVDCINDFDHKCHWTPEIT